MKEQHIKQLSSIKKDDGLEQKLTELLANDEMTFEELMSCCCNKPPLTIKPEILRSIGKKYSNGDGLKKSSEKAFKLFQYACDKGDNFATAACGLYYYNGRAGKIDYDEALKHFLKYYGNVKTSAVAFKIAIIYLIRDNTQTATEYLKQISNEDLDKPTADKLLEAITKNDHLFILGKMFYDEKNYRTAIKLFLKVKTGNFLKEANELINEILHNELVKLYPKVEADKDTEEKVNKKIDKPNLKGWTKNIGKSLLDGYDKNVFSNEITSFKKTINDYNQLDTELKPLRKKLKHAKEKGNSFKSVAKIAKKIEKITTQLAETKEKKSTAESELPQLIYAARRKELKREYYVQKRFFDPQRTNKSQTKDLALSLQADRFYKDDTAEPQQLEKIPARRIITAERSTIEASKNILGLGNSWANRDQLGWIAKRRNRERIKLGKTEIKYYQDPGIYTNHLGNYFMDNIGTYHEILLTLNRITKSTEEPNKPNEQKLAKFMLRYAKTGKSVSIDELKKINDKIDEKDVDLINTIFYHIFVKEMSRRMASNQDKYDIPVTIVQARAIKLIAEGHLTINEVFAQDAPYGVVTDEQLFNNHEEVIEKINRINRLYDEKILQEKFNTQLLTFFNKHPKGVLIASRRQLHNELKETYGGESDTDTDSDGYSSSEDQQTLEL